MRFFDKKENNIEELLNIPIELRSNDQFKKIAEICYSSYEVDPKNIFAMRQMMTCSLHLWMPDNAIFWADKILEIDECDLHALGIKAGALSDENRRQTSSSCWHPFSEIESDYQDGRW